MHLAMAAMAHACGFGKFAHFLHIPLKRIQIQHEARGLNIRFIHAGQGRNVIANFVFVEFHMSVHWFHSP